MRVHWFAFTMFAERKEFDALYQEFLVDTFGNYTEKGHGGRGYRSIATVGAGIRIYFDPVSLGQRGNHIHVEIPGEACDCMTPDAFREIVTYLQFGRRVNGQLQPDLFSIKRLDIAFDHELFTPDQWLQAIQGSEVVTLAKRDKIRVEQSPFLPRDDGQIGTMTVYLGSNEADRMIRVYNKRGPTRLEFQMRDERAHLVALDVLLRYPSKWHEAALAHVSQYITFKQGCAPDWWLAFIGSTEKADLIISSSRVVSLNKSKRWMTKQVAPLLSVIFEIEGEDYA